MLVIFKWLLTEFHSVIHKSLTIYPFLMGEKLTKIVHETVQNKSQIYTCFLFQLVIYIYNCFVVSL